MLGRRGLALGLLAALALAGLLIAQPTEIDEEAALRGNGLFRAYCSSCHGSEAVGDGAIAEYLTIKPANLTEIAQRNGGTFPFEQVWQIIDGQSKVKGHGGGEMPIWGQAFHVTDGGQTDEQVQERLRRLTNYLWSIQK